MPSINFVTEIDMLNSLCIIYIYIHANLNTMALLYMAILGWIWVNDVVQAVQPFNG